MTMTPPDIDKILEAYAAGTATAEEREIVRNYILDDASRLELLLEALRRQAMKELGLNPEKDFLPAHLKNCAPEAYEKRTAFRSKDRNKSSDMGTVPRKTLPELLMQILLK